MDRWIGWKKGYNSIHTIHSEHTPYTNTAYIHRIHSIQTRYIVYIQHKHIHLHKAHMAIQTDRQMNRQNDRWNNIYILQIHDIQSIYP